MYISKSDVPPGFYDGAGSMPDDVIEITFELYQALLNGMSAGKQLAWSEDGSPYLTEPSPPSVEQLLSLARAERDRMLSYATLRINPLQYAADLDEASDEDLALLKLWKKYSSAVNKTETKPGWPESPQWPHPPVPLE